MGDIIADLRSEVPQGPCLVLQKYIPLCSVVLIPREV